MKIAIIAWGSLLWSPGSLLFTSPWATDGPALPIEFVRISYDGRVTLAIHPNQPHQTTYWTLSALETLQEARRNLQHREGGADLSCAAYLTRDQEHLPDLDEETRQAVSQWLTKHETIDAAIWTGFVSNWQTKRQKPWSHQEVLAYLQMLHNDTNTHRVAYLRAREYINNTPPQIRPPTRGRIEEALGWTPNPLAPALFQGKT